jgi:hypothetical protein
MYALGLAILLFTVGCGYLPSPGSVQAGRYQQIENPNPPLCVPVGLDTKPPPGCGITFIDNQSGVIYIREMTDWREKNPHSGKTEFHNLKFSLPE